MIQIRPVSDLRNRYTEIEGIVKEGSPVYLTKNGHGTMVVLSLEQYADLTESIEMKLDQADIFAINTEVRSTHEDVFERVRRVIDEKY
jgi:prevent-host-death family protein